jgi:hypothetical protein
MSEISSKIGVAAGEIWRYLLENGEATPIKIKASLGMPNTMLYLALGWLSKEDEINIKQIGYSYKISLK